MVIIEEYRGVIYRWKAPDLSIQMEEYFGKHLVMAH